MNIELSLLELNDLYYSISKLVEQNEKHLKELGQNISSIEYFRNELKKSEVLRDKIQTALYDEAKRLDEALDYVQNKQRDYSGFQKLADGYSQLEKLGRGKSKY